MRLPNNTLTKLNERTGLSIQYLSDLANTSKRPGRKRAMELEQKTGIPASVWLYGTTEQIKSAIKKAA